MKSKSTEPQLPKMSIQEAVDWLDAIYKKFGRDNIPVDAIPPDVLEALQLYGLAKTRTN